MSEISNKQFPLRHIVGISYVFPDAIAGEIENGETIAVTLKPGTSWTPIYFTPGTARLESESTTGFVGRLFVNKFTCSLPGSTAGFDDSLNAVCGRAIVVSLLFSDGVSLVAGGRDKKLRFEYVRDINTASGHSLTFENSSRDSLKHTAFTPPVIVVEAAPAAPTIGLTQPTVNYRYGIAVVTLPVARTGFLYSFDNGITWSTSPLKDNLTPETNYTVYVSQKEEVEEPQSKKMDAASSRKPAKKSKSVPAKGDKEKFPF